MLSNKRGASFGTIVAVFGSILIALGVAWLIAQNWHQIPAAVKIIILLTATSLAYTAGVIFRVREYTGIGKALLVLGALLYTLSIFLIAQIFFTSASMQGTAWLIFLSWIGVLVTAFLFESSASLVVALIEFFVWIWYQFFAFATSCSRSGFRGPNEGGCFILAGSFLSIGILLSLAVAFTLFLYFRNSEKTRSVLNFCIALASSTSILWLALILLRPSTLQSSAYLMFLVSAIGFVVAYFFTSTSSLFLALSEFTVAIIFQYLAFSFRTGTEIIKPGVLAFYLLAIGILFYGLCLLHRVQEHIFRKAYQWWTAFYFLLFTYVLSFQIVLPFFWTTAAVISTPSLIFLIALGLVALAAFISGIVVSISRNAAAGREVSGVLLVIVLLIILIASTAFTSDIVGSCAAKSCYDHKDQTSCRDSPQQLNCEWQINYCGIKNCGSYRDETSCKTMANCAWYKDGGNGYCSQISCYTFQDQPSCEQAKCSWINNYCIERQCYNYREKSDCERAPEDLKCKWKDNQNFCDVQKPCEQYNNNQMLCSEQKACNWYPSDGAFIGSRGQVPLTLLLVWIIINFVFILIILAVIGYGTWQKLPKIVNLGIVFFALDIVTRYIGFIMDYWGYTSLSIIFITGGILLLLGGWFIEKWRRKLVIQAKGNREIAQRGTNLRK